MTNRNRSQAQARPRTTIPMRGTTSRQEAQLDHRSSLAIQWARAYCKQANSLGLDPTSSGIVRRALVVYLRHLASPGLDPKEEGKAVQRACSSGPVAAEDREAALQRLQLGIDQGHLPSFDEVLHGAGGLDWVQHLNNKAEDHFQAIAASPWGRMKGLARASTPADDPASAPYSPALPPAGSHSPIRD